MLAEEKGCTPAQLALAWQIRRHDDVIPIPGTSSIRRLEAQHLAGAVRACGGRPRNEEATRLAAARRDSLAAMLRVGELSPEVRAEAIEACGKHSEENYSCTLAKRGERYHSLNSVVF